MTFDVAAVAAFALVGFIAELCDAAIGLGFGVITTALLLGLGIAPAAASASVQVAKIATGAAAGLSHAALGNIDLRLLAPLTLAGIVGGVIGAYALSHIDAAIARPAIAAYLLVLGVLILGNTKPRIVFLPVIRRPEPLGLIGGVANALGGGWGPLVTASLIAGGREPRIAIGTGSLAECIVALTTSLTFAATIGISHWPIVAGLTIGGLLGAPLGAYVARHVRPRPLMIAVGLTIVALSASTLLTALSGARLAAAP
jgi:hypothetical protein